MRYMLLIYGSETEYERLSDEARNADYQEYADFTDEIVRRGFVLQGEALQNVASATTVRIRDGKVLTTDGPFAETKEQLGGYYILDCRDLDEAIEMATKIPGARHGAIEIRPILTFE